MWTSKCWDKQCSDITCWVGTNLHLCQVRLPHWIHSSVVAAHLVSKLPHIFNSSLSVRSFSSRALEENDLTDKLLLKMCGSFDTRCAATTDEWIQCGSLTWHRCKFVPTQQVMSEHCLSQHLLVHINNCRWLQQLKWCFYTQHYWKYTVTSKLLHVNYTPRCIV